MIDKGLDKQRQSEHKNQPMQQMFNHKVATQCIFILFALIT